MNQKTHINFTIAKSGLVLNSEWPHLGAFPDRIVQCDCCGKGVVEIKCPYCHCLNAVESVTTDKQSYLVFDANGTLHIDRTHAYYYQVQTQMFVCNVDYCDFCVCTFPTGANPSLHVESLVPDVECWSSCVDASRHFHLFKCCVLPELLRNWYTKSSLPELQPAKKYILKQKHLSTVYCQ